MSFLFISIISVSWCLNVSFITSIKFEIKKIDSVHILTKALSLFAIIWLLIYLDLFLLSYFKTSYLDLVIYVLFSHFLPSSVLIHYFFSFSEPDKKLQIQCLFVIDCFRIYHPNLNYQSINSSTYVTFSWIS